MSLIGAGRAAFGTVVATAPHFPLESGEVRAISRLPTGHEREPVSSRAWRNW